MVGAATRGAADGGGRSRPHRGHGRRLRGHGTPVARLSPRLRIDAQRGDRRARTIIWLGDREQRGEDLEEHSRTAVNLVVRFASVSGSDKGRFGSSISALV